MQKKMEYVPIIIIGAPRSGTNMLRDILVKLPGAGTWSCDEINYIWRHYNIYYPSDVFSAKLATPKVKKFIQEQFQKIANKSHADYIIEKTCANSLRVNFINEIFPEAKYIFIVRDGRDVIASAMKRWKAQLDVPYILRKVRYVPASDLPYYASRYLFNRIYRLFSHEKRLAFWGPRLENMETILKQYSLEEVCAIQWQQCVDYSERDFLKINQSKIYRLRYEDFVINPREELIKISQFLNISIPEKQILNILNVVSTQSIGKWRKELDEELITKLIPLMKKSLQRYEYI